MSDNTKAILGALSDKCTCVYVDNGDGDPELLMYHCTQCHAAEWIEALEADCDKARAEVERLKGVLQRLGSAKAFDMARTLDAKDAELIMRMDFARSALEAKP